MKIQKTHLNLAIQAHLDQGIAGRGIKLRQVIPSLGFDGTREVYSLVDPLLKRAQELAFQSSYIGAPLTPAQANQKLKEEYPDLDEDVQTRLMKWMDYCCAKG